MLHKKIGFLLCCGIALLRLDPISSTDPRFVDVSSEGLLDEIQTNVVLLPDSGGRSRRDTSAEEQLGRGYSQEQAEFLDDVDITEDKIEKNVKSNNLSMSENGTTKYYQSEFILDGLKFFTDLDSTNKSGDHEGRVREHSMLSQSYRRAATINLKFRFPFYGHEVENITIATGGFLYTGEYVHSWLAATQYIAPLMANFDTSNNNNAKIRYLDTGNSLIVEWKDVYLQEREKEGPFTFQVVLNTTGDISFAYSNIPLPITTIQDEEHPVKVGLSDAYIIDRTIFFVRRKTIYEYHRVNMKHMNISSHSAIVFKALFTCNKQKDCHQCLNQWNITSAISCGWCPALNRCSDGMDRNRQVWLTNNCDKNKLTEQHMCDAPQQVESTSRIPEHLADQAARQSDPSIVATKGSSVSPGGLTALVLIISLVITVFGWVGYAYFQPHTWSGQLLIKYRPGAWRWRQGGARYTAASIHM